MLQVQCLAECIALPCESVEAAEHTDAEPTHEMPCHGSEQPTPMTADHGGHGAHSDDEPCSSHIGWSAKTSNGFQKTDLACKDVSARGGLPHAEVVSSRSGPVELASARSSASLTTARTAVLLI